MTSPLRAGVIQIAAWNTANKPNDPAEHELFRTVLSGIGDTASRRLSILAVSETDPTSAEAIADIMNTTYATTAYQAAFSTPDAGNDRTGFVFDTSAVTLLSSKTISSGLTHHVLVGQFQPLDLPEDLFVYSTHLKSGDSTSDRTLREKEATIIRDHADALGQGRNVVVLGDFNMHGSSEAVWSALVAPGNAALADLANAPGEWRDNPAFLRLHTQDPRTSMDDRFDIAFASAELLDGQGIDYRLSSFRVFGNNGTHLLNQPITTGTGAPSNVLLALSMASDHLPIVAEFTYSASHWNVDANGEWSAPANWSAGGVPNGLSPHAILGSAITQSRSVTVTEPVTVGRIDFNSAHSYTVDGAGQLSLVTTSGAAEINVINGSHSIAAPLNLAHDTLVTVKPPAAALSIAGLATGRITLTKDGAGTLVVNNIRTESLSVIVGTVKIAANGTPNGTSKISSLSLNGGTFDLTNNAAVIDYSDASPVATLRQHIRQGRGGPGLGKRWDGTGITSSAAATANTTEPESRSVGYAENSALPLGPYTNFRGQPVDNDSVIIAFTRTGDANLDGVVNDDDVTIVSATYLPGVPNPHWALGDFDYNGFVDDDDMTLLGVFYDPSAVPLIAPASASGTSAVAVPEPRTLLLVVIGCAALIAASQIRRVSHVNLN